MNVKWCITRDYLREAEYYSKRQNYDRVESYQRRARNATEKAESYARKAKYARERAQSYLRKAINALERSE